MKRIVCYGDSNTFGYNPKDGSGFDVNTRWTSVLQEKLGTEFEVINEGMCDRTGFVNNPKGEIFSSPKHFPKLISSLDEIDILILWIGTNDLQFQYDTSSDTIANGLENLIKLAQTKVKKVIIIPPVILSNKILEGNFNYQFDETSITKSKEVGIIYETLANMFNCQYFDVNKFVKPSDIDGLHYNENSHKIIAEKLAQLLKLQS